jgi:hypothetical protein
MQNKEMFNDWRLPTIQELLTLVDYAKHSPASNLADTKSNGYWSSTVDISNYDDAWCVGFGSGTAYYNDKHNSYYVRCVRNNDNRLEWSASSTFAMPFHEAVAYARNLVATVYYKG